MVDSEFNEESFIHRTLKAIQSDISMMKTDMQSMNVRLGAVEAHMAGFMSTARYLDTEIDALRGRVEVLEDRPKTET